MFKVFRLGAIINMNNREAIRALFEPKPEERTLVSMSGYDFVNRLISGERDFSNIKLEEGFDLNSYDRFEEMQNYLRTQELRENPIVLNNSDISYVKANGIYMPYVQAEGTVFDASDLTNAYLWGGNFYRANFGRAKMKGTELSNAVLTYANLRDAEDVETCRCLYTNWVFAKVTPGQKERMKKMHPIYDFDFFWLSTSTFEEALKYVTDESKHPGVEGFVAIF